MLRAGIGGGQQAAVGADLDDRVTRAQLEHVVARVRRVEETEAVLPPRDPQEGLRPAVHEDRVAGDGVVAVPEQQRAVRAEVAVLDHQRDVVRAAREVEVALERVVDQVEAREPHVDVARRRVVRVVVVPERGGKLVVRVRVVLASPGPDQVGGVAVASRGDMSAVVVDGGRDAQAVPLPDDDAPSALGADRRTRELPAVAPDLRPLPGEDLDALTPHGEVVVVGGGVAPHRAEHRRDAQRHRERRRGAARRRVHGDLPRQGGGRPGEEPHLHHLTPGQHGPPSRVAPPALLDPDGRRSAATALPKSPRTRSGSRTSSAR